MRMSRRLINKKLWAKDPSESHVYVTEREWIAAWQSDIAAVLEATPKMPEQHDAEPPSPGTNLHNAPSFLIFNVMKRDNAHLLQSLIPFQIDICLVKPLAHAQWLLHQQRVCIYNKHSRGKRSVSAIPFFQKCWWTQERGLQAQPYPFRNWTCLQQTGMWSLWSK